MTNFNERTNTLLYKNIISHTLFLKGLCWLCVRDELETGTDCYIDPKFFFRILTEVAQPWVTEGPKTSVCHWFSLQHVVSNWLQLTQAICALVILLFNAHLRLLFFRLFTQVHLLIDGSVKGKSITQILSYHVQVTHWWVGAYLSAEMQLVYSIAPADWVKGTCEKCIKNV